MLILSDKSSFSYKILATKSRQGQVFYAALMSYQHIHWPLYKYRYVRSMHKRSCNIPSISRVAHVISQIVNFNSDLKETLPTHGAYSSMMFYRGKRVVCKRLPYRSKITVTRELLLDFKYVRANAEQRTNF